jgi:hypothetical protein
MERLKIQQARIVSGTVEIFQGDQWLPADDTIINSIGAADSTGFVIIGIDSARYITNTQLDAVYILDKLTALCDQIIEIGNTITFAIPSVGIAPNLELQAVALATQLIKAEIEEKDLV